MTDGEKYRIIVSNHEITPRRASEACETGRGDNTGKEATNSTPGVNPVKASVILFIKWNSLMRCHHPRVSKFEACAHTFKRDFQLRSATRTAGTINNGGSS